MLAARRKLINLASAGMHMLLPPHAHVSGNARPGGERPPDSWNRWRALHAPQSRFQIAAPIAPRMSPRNHSRLRKQSMDEVPLRHVALGQGLPGRV